VNELKAVHFTTKLPLLAGRDLQPLLRAYRHAGESPAQALEHLKAVLLSSAVRTLEEDSIKPTAGLVLPSTRLFVEQWWASKKATHAWYLGWSRTDEAPEWFIRFAAGVIEHVATLVAWRWKDFVDAHQVPADQRWQLWVGLVVVSVLTLVLPVGGFVLLSVLAGFSWPLWAVVIYVFPAVVLGNMLAHGVIWNLLLAPLFGLLSLTTDADLPIQGKLDATAEHIKRVESLMDSYRAAQRSN
jgi:hypothetical protein